MDLQVALVLISATEDKEQAQELSDGDRANHHGGRVKRPVFELDLNCLPDCISADELSEDQQTEQSEPGLSPSFLYLIVTKRFYNTANSCSSIFYS